MTHATHPNTWRIVNKVFWEIGINNVDKTQIHGCKTMAGSRGMHQVMYSSEKHLLDNLLLANRFK
jgi:hypothetical protein